MNYYTNVFTIGNNVRVRSVENDERIRYSEEYKPTVFIPTKEKTKFRTIHGEPVGKVQPGSIRDCRNFMERYKGVENFSVYGYTDWSHQYIGDKFFGCDFDLSKIRICTIDIEVASEQGFPTVENVREELIAITIKDSLTKGRYVLGREPVDVADENTKYICCPTEMELIEKFLEVWNTLQPDIVTGWNSKLYDIPYLVRRMDRVMGDGTSRKMSVWNVVKERTVKIMGREEYVYMIAGLSQLDYLDLYKKYTYVSQESYKLDHIAFVELGERKMSYAEHDTMHNFYKQDYQKFIEYNIKDVELVDRLEDKLRLIELCVTMAYDAGINYEDVFAQTRFWDAVIYNHLRQKNIVVPPRKENPFKPEFTGGHVKEIKDGGISSDWVVSFDLNSLYPHLIMQYNISPETLRTDLPSFFVEVSELVKGTLPLPDVPNATMAGNGHYFSTDKQGFLPELMQQFYDDRVKYKQLQMDALKSGDKENVAKYETRQMARKISLNSAYGALGNEYFRYFDVRQAEAITKSGQLAIRWIERELNEYLNSLLKTDGVDYVIASDTDSVYLTLDSIVKTHFQNMTDKNKIVSALDQVCVDLIEPFIEKSYQKLADYMKAYQQRMVMKREVIADRGIWTAKKRYVLNVWDNEGVRNEKPKIKIMGIEAVRSSTPTSCRQRIMDSLSIIMDSTEDELIEYVKEFREEFMQMPVSDISFPRTVKGIDKYSSSVDLYTKGTPFHVKGTIIYNSLVRDNKLERTYPIIKNNEKIKFVYLKEPNPTTDRVIAFINSLPSEFGLDKYIDYGMQFEKAYLDPLRNVLNVVGWHYEKQASLESFFV